MCVHRTQSKIAFLAEKDYISCRILSKDFVPCFCLTTPCEQKIKAAYSASAMQRVRMLLRVHLVDIKCPVQTDLIQPERNPLVSSLNFRARKKI